jgi:hypothetical protein
LYRPTLEEDDSIINQSITTLFEEQPLATPNFLKSFNGNDPFTIKAIFHVFPKRIVKTFVHREFYKILNIFRCPGAQWIDPGRRPFYCSGGQQSGDLPCSHLQAP